jgi:hypothetical protein
MPTPLFLSELHVESFELLPAPGMDDDGPMKMKPDTGMTVCAVCSQGCFQDTWYQCEGGYTIATPDGTCTAP